jgi:hypothetical protein
METSTTPQTFRALVAEVAARAKEKLPASINGRLEAAVKIVLAHDVTRLDDGRIEVGSCSDPMKVYTLEGDTCTCEDWQHGRAPGGWCKHRISAAIDRRVREVLAHQAQAAEAPTAHARDEGDLVAVRPTPPPTASAPQAVSLGEAPASCNVYVMIGGHKVQVTLRDSDESRMLARLQVLLERYPAAPAQLAPPASTPPTPAAHGRQRRSNGSDTQEIGWCQKHGVEMTLNTKAGRQWWSHRTADGWCKGK